MNLKIYDFFYTFRKEKLRKMDQEKNMASDEIVAAADNRESVYHFNKTEYHETINLKPWSRDPDYFKHCHISTLAATKMTFHTFRGEDKEVMGYLIGKIVADSFIIMDCCPLPVVSTETRVNAHEDAHEYSVKFLEAMNENRPEQVVGWYHSHPGYGCWLSGIDVNTQQAHQLAQDPFIAIVIDPKKTIENGSIEIGAFRTYPIGTQNSDNQAELMMQNSMVENETTFTSNTVNLDQENQDGQTSMVKSLTSLGTENSKNARSLTKIKEILKSSKCDLNILNLDQDKKDDFGVHKDAYYELKVTFYKNKLDGDCFEWLKSVSKNDDMDDVNNDNEQVVDENSIFSPKYFEKELKDSNQKMVKILDFLTNNLSTNRTTTDVPVRSERLTMSKANESSSSSSSMVPTLFDQANSIFVNQKSNPTNLLQSTTNNHPDNDKNLQAANQIIHQVFTQFTNQNDQNTNPVKEIEKKIRLRNEAKQKMIKEVLLPEEQVMRQLSENLNQKAVIDYLQILRKQGPKEEGLKDNLDKAFDLLSSNFDLIF